MRSAGRASVRSAAVGGNGRSTRGAEAGMLEEGVLRDGLPVPAAS